MFFVPPPPNQGGSHEPAWVHGAPRDESGPRFVSLGEPRPHLMPRPHFCMVWWLFDQYVKHQSR